MNNLLRFQGKASYAMVGITIGGLLNIALDPLFIFTPVSYTHLVLRNQIRRQVCSTVISKTMY